MECIFCKVSNKEIPSDVIFEDDNTVVILDIDWAVKGHILVIWKKHEENISDLTSEEFSKFSEVLRKAEKILLGELKLGKSVILKSGGLISHFHFHIYPIQKETSWDEVKSMFDKKTRYEASEKEKTGFILNLRNRFLSNKL